MASADTPPHRTLIDFLSENDRRRLWAECERRLECELRESRRRAASYESRVAANLLSAAIAYSGQQKSREEIRALSTNVCRNAQLRRIRCELGQWESFHVDGPGAARFNRQELAGYVVAAFHFGDYRMLPFHLAAQGVKVDLLSDAENTLLAREVISSARIARHVSTGSDQLRSSIGAGGDGILCLDSSDRHTPWQLLRNLRNGRTAIIFPDGNSGVSGDEGHQGNSVVVNLLGKRIVVKSGPAILAYAARTGVIPVFPHSEGERTSLRVFAPIRPNSSETLQQYRNRVAVALFNHLDAEIAGRPHEWEEWHNFFRWLSASSQNDGSEGFDSGAVASCELPHPAARARLLLVDDGLWRLRIGDEWHVIDVRAWQSFGTDAELGRLVESAERGMTVDAWWSGVRDLKAGQSAFSFLHSTGKILLQNQGG